LELFSGLVPVQQYLHVWTEAERANKKAPAQGRGESLPKQAGGNVEGERHHAAAFSGELPDNSGQISAQSSGRKSLRVTAP
jgi:hypothetical protein